MDLELTGRTALVTGASSGLGLASAQALRAEGVNVVMFARREHLLRTEAERIGGTAVAGDLRSNADLQRAISAATAMGGPDILVLNGGGPPAGAAVDATATAVREAFDLLFGPMVALVNFALPHLLDKGWGRIISISSGSVRTPVANLALSNAVRPGVWGYLKALAAEVADRGVTVNSVAAGALATDRTRQLHGDSPPAGLLAQIPAGRLGGAQELGDMVCFLSSARAAYVTGAFIPVDGGLSRAL
jgi:3-oxoacyl-[acyl-carrier protein] reductase